MKATDQKAHANLLFSSLLHPTVSLARPVFFVFIVSCWKFGLEVNAVLNRKMPWEMEKNLIVTSRKIV
jgi:hypothetical protein